MVHVIIPYLKFSMTEYWFVENMITLGLPLIGRPTTQSMHKAAGSAKETGSQPRDRVRLMMIGNMIMVRTVFEVVRRWLYIITAMIRV
jgi:hypothetical protein